MLNKQKQQETVMGLLRKADEMQFWFEVGAEKARLATTEAELAEAVRWVVLETIMCLPMGNLLAATGMTKPDWKEIRRARAELVRATSKAGRWQDVLRDDAGYFFERVGTCSK